MILTYGQWYYLRSQIMIWYFLHFLARENIIALAISFVKRISFPFRKYHCEIKKVFRKRLFYFTWSGWRKGDKRVQWTKKRRRLSVRKGEFKRKRKGDQFRTEVPERKRKKKTPKGVLFWSGWRESNPRSQLGKLELCHWVTPAYIIMISSIWISVNWT